MSKFDPAEFWKKAQSADKYRVEHEANRVAAAKMATGIGRYATSGSAIAPAPSHWSVTGAPIPLDNVLSCDATYGIEVGGLNKFRLIRQGDHIVGYILRALPTTSVWTRDNFALYDIAGNFQMYSEKLESWEDALKGGQWLQANFPRGWVTWGNPSVKVIEQPGQVIWDAGTNEVKPVTHTCVAVNVGFTSYKPACRVCGRDLPGARVE